MEILFSMQRKFTAYFFYKTKTSWINMLLKSSGQIKWLKQIVAKNKNATDHVSKLHCG